MTGKLCLAQDPAADALLDAHPFALLMGMLLDQQIPISSRSIPVNPETLRNRGIGG